MSRISDRIMTTRIRNADIVIAYDAVAEDHVYRRDLDVVFDESGILHLGDGFTGEVAREIDGKASWSCPASSTSIPTRRASPATRA